MQICANARRQHASREDAERAVEIYYPAGYLYSVVEHQTVTCATTFAVVVWNGEGTKRLGYVYDPREAADCGEC